MEDDNIKELDSLEAYERGKKDTRKKSIILTSFITILSIGLGTAIGMGVSKLLDPVPSKVRDIYKILRDNWFYQGEIDDLEKELVYMMTSGLDENKYDNYLIYTDNYADQGLDLTGEGAFGATFNNSYANADVDGINKSFGGLRIHSLANGNFKRDGFKKDDVIIAFKTADDQEFKYVEDYAPSIALKNMKPKKAGDPVTFKYVRDGKILENTSTTGDYREDQFTDYGLTTDNNGKNVLTIGIHSFLGSNTFIRDFKDIVNSYTDTNIDRLVLDMRGNGGGYTSYSRDLAFLFLKNGQTMYSEKNSKGDTFATYKQTGNPYSKLENASVDILLNSRSASATELFSLALKDNERATIYGETSYGKGIEQTVIRMNDNSYLRLTTAQIFGPKGYSIHKKGITPDYQTNYYQDILRNVVSNPYIKGEGNFGYRLSYSEEQRVLSSLHLLGYEGDEIETLLKEFQNDYKLEQTGEYDSKTLYRIQGEISKKYNECYDRELTNLTKGTKDEVRAI